MCFAAVARAGSVLDAPAFSIAPADLLAAAKAAPPGGDVYVVGRATDVSLDAAHEVTRFHAIFVIQTQAGVSKMTDPEAKYVPGRDAAPTIRVRVIDRAGQVHELDASAISDAADTSSGGDRHRVVAKLAKLEIGSIVELDVQTDIGVTWKSGTSGEALLDSPDATGETRLAIAAPTSAHLRIAEHGLPAGVHGRRAVANGREVWSLVLGATGPRPFEPGEPDDIASRTSVAYSTVTSWNAYARELRASIEQRIAAGPPAWPAGIAKAPTLDTVRAITAWVRAHVPVDHSDRQITRASFPPATPADAIAHGAADGLAAATLTVALLRQASLPADVALIGTGFGGNGDPSLPGSLPFDRAIVRLRIGNADAWLDPSSHFVPAGRLGASADARRALVLADATSAPVTTPAMNVADNAVHEVHTYALAEQGFATVTIVRRDSGDLAAFARAYTSERGIDKAEDDFGAYVAERFAGQLSSLTSSPLDDLEHPYERTMQIDHVGVAYADGYKVAITLPSADVLDELPSELRSGSGRRAHPYRFAVPFSHDVENRLVVPDGYVMPAAQADRTLTFGALRLVEHQRVDSRTLIVTYRLEPTKPLLSAAEFEATRNALGAWLAAPAPFVTITSTAQALHERHEDVKALAELDRLAKLHPAEAMHHELLAELEIQLGAGTAGRREAKLATQLEPKRARAWAVLGWALEHDAFGRNYELDADHAGARAALETAHKLDPDDRVATEELAHVLELDAAGARVFGGADLRAAIAMRRELARTSRDPGPATALARDLLWNAQAGDAAAVLRDAPRSDEGQALMIVATALGPEGPDAALRQADALATGDAHRTLLLDAGSIAWQLRSYHIARRLIGPLGGKGDAAALDAMLVHTARFDTPFKPTTQPTSVAIELALESVHHDRPRAVFWDAETATEHGVRAPWADMSPRLAAVDDVVRSLIPTARGDAPLWRVELALAELHEVAYLAADHGAPKYIGGPEHLAGVGRHLLRLLARGDDATAKRLLDWVAVDKPSEWVTRVWGKDLATDHEQMEIAAAVLAGASDSAHALPILTACKSSNAKTQRSCDAVAIEVLAHEARWNEVVDRATAIEAAWADDPFAREYHIIGLRHLGKLDEAERIATAASPSVAGEARVEFARAHLEIDRGDLPEARTLLEAVMQNGKATGGQVNGAAWEDMAAGGNLEKADTGAHRAVAMLPKNGGALNTLAAVEVEEDDLAGGLRDERAALDLESEVEAGDWYVMGRYYELLGLRDDAIAAYRKTTPPKVRDPAFFVSYDLADKRLAALNVKR